MLNIVSFYFYFLSVDLFVHLIYVNTYSFKTIQGKLPYFSMYKIPSTFLTQH